VVWPRRSSEPLFGGHASPGLAREDKEKAASSQPTQSDEDDALGEAMRWLAARRGSSGDRG
jgi:hypothetical protein